MKFNIATLVTLSTILGHVHARDEPVNDATAAMNRVPVSVASLYREGEFGMGKAWQGLRKLEESAVFLHRDVRRAEKDMVYVWTDKEFVHPHYHQKEWPYLSMRERIIIDCSGMRAGVVESAFYEKRFGTGEPIARVQQRPEMIDILPDSMEEQMHHIACAKPVVKAVKPVKVLNPDVKTASSPVVGQAPGAGAKPEVKTESKPESKPELKPEPKPDAKSASRPARSVSPTADKIPGKTQT